MNNYDITKRYSWNNHKEMDEQKLFKTYNTLTSEEKKLVDAHLTEKRKKLLDKQIAYHRNNSDISYFMIVFEAFFEQKRFSSPDIAALTFAIIRHYGYLDLYNEKDKYYSREENDFNQTKAEMLNWVKKLDERDVPTFLADLEEDDPTPKEVLYKLLEKLEYIPIKTKADLINEKRKLFRHIYRSSGMRETTVNEIVKDLIAYIEHVYIETKQNDVTINPKYEKLAMLLQNKDMETHHLNEELVSLVKRIQIKIDRFDDNFAEIELKISTLSRLLSDKFIHNGEELLKVHSPVENYSVNFDLYSIGPEEYISNEKRVFKHYDKILTQQHVDKIMKQYDIYNNLPKNLDDLDKERSDFIESLY